MFICLGSPPLVWPHTPPNLHTEYGCTLYTVYNIHTWKGVSGERANQGEGLRGNTSQSWSKIPIWLTVSPVYKLYKTPVKTTFRVWCLYSCLVHGLLDRGPNCSVLLRDVRRYCRLLMEFMSYDWNGTQISIPNFAVCIGKMYIYALVPSPRVHYKIRVNHGKK